MEEIIKNIRKNNDNLNQIEDVFKQMVDRTSII